MGFPCKEDAVKMPKLCSYNILVKQVACGDSHTHILSRDGYVYSMGSNINGVLGLSNSEAMVKHVTAPQLITNLSGISQISTGRSHTLALDFSSKVFGWGRSDTGAIGIRVTCSSYPSEFDI